MTTPTEPLPSEFPRALRSALALAEGRGHTDIAYLIEMAVQLAEQRVGAQAIEADEDRLRRAPTPPAS